MAEARTRRTGLSIKDVARLADVSAQTVSRVANGAPNVRPETRDRVLLAMDQLGYAPNHAARALRSGMSSNIGVMAHRFERTGEALTMKAVVEASAEEGFNVTLIDVQGHSAASWRKGASRLSTQSMAGLVVIRAESVPTEELSLPPDLPIAVSDSRLAGYLPAVVADQMQGTELAVEHLLALGHRNVHHVAGPSDSEPARIRLGSWRSTLERAGIRPPAALPGDWSAESGYQAGLRLASSGEATAVFCANDEMAFGLMRALHERGLAVPDDVSVVGFDDIGLAGYAAVPLTTVRQDFHAIGHELMRLLMVQMRGAAKDSLGRTVVPTELVVRSSTAAPRG